MVTVMSDIILDVEINHKKFKPNEDVATDIASKYSITIERNDGAGVKEKEVAMLIDFISENMEDFVFDK